MARKTKAKSARKTARKTARKPASRPKARVSAIPPKGYHSVTPYLIVDDAAGALDFYKKAFAAKEVMRMAHDGKIGHAEIQIGDSRVMLADEWPDHDAIGPKTVGGTPVTIHLYVKNVDSTVERAARAGAKILREVKDQFYGDRSGTLLDPFGHKWNVATHTEDLTPREITRRADEMMKQGG